MEGSIYADIAKQIGMGAGFFALCFFLLRWAVKHWEQMTEMIVTMMANAKEERDKWQGTIQEMHDERVTQHIKSDELHRRNSDAHEYQKKEHEKMIENLTEIGVTLKSLNGK